MVEPKDIDEIEGTEIGIATEEGDMKMVNLKDITEIEGAAIGPGGGKVIFENDRVRVWDIELEVGQRCALHTHHMDYMLVQIEGDEICAEPHEDTQGEYNRRMRLETRPGDFSFIEKGGSEVAFNSGTKKWREICIELKD